MPYTVMACIAMAHIVMAHVVMATGAIETQLHAYTMGFVFADGGPASSAIADGMAIVRV